MFEMPQKQDNKPAESQAIETPIPDVEAMLARAEQMNVETDVEISKRFGEGSVEKIRALSKRFTEWLLQKAEDRNWLPETERKMRLLGWGIIAGGAVCPGGVFILPIGYILRKRANEMSINKQNKSYATQ